MQASQSPEFVTGRPCRPRECLPFVLALTVVLLLAYSSLRGAGYIWDDDDYILNNAALRSFDGLRRIWCELGAVPQYYPLVHTTFWLEYHLWGLQPAGYHIVNLLLHAGAALMLAAVVDTVAKVPAERLLTPGRVAALWFAVHPVAVESAAWITERKNVLSLLLALSAAWFYLRWQSSEARRDYGQALLLFAGAMLSKTVVCSLPAVLLVLTWHGRGRLVRRDWLALAPMFVIGLALAAVTVWTEKHVVGASGAEWHLGMSDRVVLAGRALWFYVGKLVWPVGLSFIYPRWQPDGTDLLQWLAPLAWLGVGGGLLALRSRAGRTPFACWLIFTGVLVPALGFIDVYPFRYSFVADHFQYHAGTALIAGLAAASGRLRPRQQLTLVTVITVALAILTWQRCPVFHNEETLWRQTLAVNPDAWIAHNNLGLIFLDRGRYAQAESGFRAAIALKADHGNAWTNLGMALDMQDKVDEARTAFAQAQRLLPDRIDMWQAVARFHVRRQEPAAALAAWREILLRIPGDQEALQGAAAALTAAGHPEQAQELLKRAGGQ